MSHRETHFWVLKEYSYLKHNHGLMQRRLDILEQGTERFCVAVPASMSFGSTNDLVRGIPPDTPAKFNMEMCLTVRHISEKEAAHQYMGC